MVPCCITVVVEHMEGYLKKKVCFSEPHLANVSDGRRTKQGQFIPDISGMIWPFLLKCGPPGIAY